MHGDNVCLLIVDCSGSHTKTIRGHCCNKSVTAYLLLIGLTSAVEVLRVVDNFWFYRNKSFASPDLCLFKPMAR